MYTHSGEVYTQPRCHAQMAGRPCHGGPSAGSCKAVATGDTSGCALKTNDELQCWYSHVGEDASGAFQSVSVGEDHACAVDATGDIDCWGGNSFGQLGIY